MYQNGWKEREREKKSGLSIYFIGDLSLKSAYSLRITGDAKTNSKALWRKNEIRAEKDLYLFLKLRRGYIFFLLGLIYRCLCLFIGSLISSLLPIEVARPAAFTLGFG